MIHITRIELATLFNAKTVNKRTKVSTSRSERKQFGRGACVGG